MSSVRMFDANENNVKKRFQKPNILRKRSKPPSKTTIPMSREFPSLKNLVTSPIAPEPKLQFDKNTNVICKQYPAKKPQRLILDNNILSAEGNNSDFYQIDGNLDVQKSLVKDNKYINSTEKDASDTTINVESFLNNSEVEQMVSQADIESEINSMMEQEWCLDFIDNTQEIIIEDIDGSQLGSLCLATAPKNVDAVPLSAVMSQEQSPDMVTYAVPAQNLTLEYLASSTMNFKCDIPNCTKRFRSEQALNKHKASHDKEPKVNKQVIECPVKKISSYGIEEACSVCCHTKEEMVKHLNEEHNPEDAMFICSECDRRFYWASGLRAHARSHSTAARAPLACAWPGCGRAFRQPCRLREHMRVHTGDKPYPCRYPNCGASFRTASKLMRHARHHTGERRHACGACGRAFRRREHLKDHATRHHARPPRACPRPGCKKKFANEEALAMHKCKVHKQDPATSPALDDSTAPALPILQPVATVIPKSEDTFLVNLDSPQLDSDTLSDVDTGLATSIETLTSNNRKSEAPMMAMQQPGITDVGSEAVAEEGREEGPELELRVGESEIAARTHRTWPFPSLPQTPPVFHHDDNAQYVLEEDVQQVDMSEGSESNIYTIRSDLFLHGNVLNNEDSEQMAGPETSSLLVVPQTGESDLSLLDAHPTIDLMQEELMYTDAAVDESSFRVFLLSGEELS